MLQMSVRQFREALTALEQILEREGEFIVTRHGRPLAKVVSLNPVRKAPSHADLRASIPPMQAGSEDLIRQDRNGEAGSS
jgi:antitoxin (DNA-binding transcriptional repressor) of toxin-antitoxin stability system